MRWQRDGQNTSVSFIKTTIEQNQNKITDIDGPSIMITEVSEAIRQLKTGKAPGIDGITGEHLKALDEMGLQIITCNDIYDSSCIPKDLRHSLFIKITKKPKAMECTEHRTICLMSHVMKIVLTIIMERNKIVFEREIGETQTGFRPGIGTKEGVFNLRAIMDKYLEVNKNIYICFIDYEKAFDRVFHYKLVEVLDNIEIDGKEINSEFILGTVSNSKA